MNFLWANCHLHASVRDLFTNAPTMSTERLSLMCHAFLTWKLA